MSHPKHTSSHEYIFVRKSFLQLFPPEIVVLLRKATIYIYNTRKDYLLNPECPAKFFNIHTAEITLKDGWIVVKDRYCFQTFTHVGDQSQINKFYKACMAAKSSMEVESLFPRKFKEMCQRAAEHSKEHSNKQNVQNSKAKSPRLAKQQSFKH